MRKLLLAAAMAAITIEPSLAAQADRYTPRQPVMVTPTTPAAAAPRASAERTPRVEQAAAGPNLFEKLFGIRPNKPRQQPQTNARATDPAFLPAMVRYDGGEKPGTIVIDTDARYLYLVEPGGKARRYGVGVGRPGFEWAGAHRITRKAEWPTWTPPPQMRERERKRGRNLPASMAGGPGNPLGARAMYLGSTLYRIHGTSEPWTIGRAVSSGCIRMRNEDVSDLYERVGVGTKVIVL